MNKIFRFSLATKCQILFGIAVLLLVSASLYIVFQRMEQITKENPLKNARDTARLANIYGISNIQTDEQMVNDTIQVQRWDAQEFATIADEDTFVNSAYRHAMRNPLANEWSHFDNNTDNPRFRYIQAFRTENPEVTTLDNALNSHPIDYLFVIDMDASTWVSQRLANIISLITAGAVACLIAIVAFWYITSHVILRPLDTLKACAEKAANGDLMVRADIQTGDEFERVSEVFNSMLTRIQKSQLKLTEANRMLDAQLDELAVANKTLDRANQIKTDFLSNVTHELRTPMNSIIGFSEILEEELQNTEDPSPTVQRQARYAGNIHRSSTQLLELINDLLDIAKVEAGRMDIHLKPLHVKELFQNLITAMKPQSDKYNVNITVDLEEDLPIIETDVGKIRQILFNFLSNALKFCPSGGNVILSGKLRTESQGQTEVSAWLHLSVQDDGPGISPADQARIFEKFTQLDQSETRQVGGTGLGLNISKQLADLLQGNIELSSAPNQGSTFTLIIPLAKYT